MYGTVAKLRLKPGSWDKAMEAMREYDDLDVPGFMSEVTYRSDEDPDVCYMAVVFDSKEAYRANAESPEQHQRYLKMRELLAEEPEWHDGEIVYHH
jgi:heme-degrading monooxygenase HmoA